MRSLACLLVGLASLVAVELPPPEDLPDPIGLGLRLVLIDFLREQVGVEPPVGADEDALLAFYQDLRRQRAAVGELARVAELRRRLWAEFGITAPDDAAEPVLAELLADQERRAAAALSRQREQEQAASTLPRPEPVAPRTPEHSSSRHTDPARGDATRIAPDWRLPSGDRPGFTRLLSTRIRVDELDALRVSVGRRDLSPREIADRVRDGVVLVASPQTAGTGMVIDASGLILTCAHVVPPQAPLRVKAAVPSAGGGRLAIMVPAEVVAIDRERDLALLVAHVRNRLVPVSWADVTEPSMGDPVVVIGNPGLGEGILEQSMTQGIISNPRQTIAGMPFLQTTAAINPGNSGGPVFNQRGAVIGLMVLKGRDVEGINFAVPRSVVMDFLRRCEEP